jgi:hypothetical protein
MPFSRESRRRAARLLKAGLVHAPCGSALGPDATWKGLPAYVTIFRGDSVHNSASTVAAAGE